MSLEHLAFGAVVTVVGLAALGQHLSGPDPEQFESLEQLEDAFAEGDISFAFFEAHVGAYTHESYVQFVTELQRVQHVGPKMAVAIARHYEVREALENSTAEEIADQVHGVGPSLANELKSIYD